MPLIPPGNPPVRQIPNGHVGGVEPQSEKEWEWPSSLPYPRFLFVEIGNLIFAYDGDILMVETIK